MAERRLLLVHAHPDDEASKAAATAARYIDEGAHVVLVTCTGGEAGEVLNPNAPPVEVGSMPVIRMQELEAACRVIGFSARYQLGFVDSGWHEDVLAVAPDSFAGQPLDVPAGALAEILRKERPQVLVTYPPNGDYPHPDHIRVHDVSMRAMDLAEDPQADVLGEPWRVPKVYACHLLTWEWLVAMHDAILARGLESPFEQWLERRAERPALPTDARIRVDGWLERRDEALRCHITQVDAAGLWFSWPRDLEREVYPWETFTRLRSDISTPDVEDDLFAGLDV